MQNDLIWMGLMPDTFNMQNSLKARALQ